MRCLIFLSLLFGASTLFAQDSISRTEIPELIQAIHDTLVFHHPFTQDETGRRILRESLADLKSTVPGLPGGDSVHISTLIHHAAGLQRATGDGHLNLSPFIPMPRLYAIMARQRIISVYHTDDVGFILNHHLPTVAGDTLPEGTQITHLDGTPVSNIVEENAGFNGLNDHGFAGGGYRIVGYNLSGFYRMMYGIRDSTLVRAVNDSGQSAEYWVDLLHTYPGSPVKPHKRDKSVRLSELVVHEFLPEDSVWHLRIRTFDNNSFSSQKVNYRKEIRKIFGRMKQSPGKGLILDLRSNGGGSINKAMKLAYYLADEPFKHAEVWDTYSPDARGPNVFSRLLRWTFGGTRRDGKRYYQPNFMKLKTPYPDRKQYGGPVVIIINELTFSAATILAHTLRQTNGINLVGATSGGSSEVIYGGRYKFYPISQPVKLTLRVPDNRIQMWRPGSGNLAPDFEVPLTRAFFLDRENDPRVNKAVELLLEQYKQQGAAAGAE